MKGKIYNILSLFIGLGTLVYMSYKIGLPVIWDNVVKTGLWFIPVIGTWLIIYIFNALAFAEIIHEKKLPETKIPFWDVLKITISGYAINYITPFVALGGEPFRIMQLRKWLTANKAASSVLLYYIMHVFSHVIFWMVSIALILFFLNPGTVVWISCLVTFAIFYFAVYWMFKKYKKGLLMITFGSLARLPLIKKKVKRFVEKRESNLREIDQHIIELFDNRKPTFYSSLFFEFIGRVVGCVEIYFIALALDVNISLVDSFIISAGSSLFANIIFFTPMQLGAREGGFVLALRSIGLASSVGIFISLATRIRELVWILIGLLFIPVKAVRKQV
jgi:uncharacterized membrane protein YbhN (UPF0104 family)